MSGHTIKLGDLVSHEVVKPGTDSQFDGAVVEHFCDCLASQMPLARVIYSGGPLTKHVLEVESVQPVIELILRHITKGELVCGSRSRYRAAQIVAGVPMDVEVGSGTLFEVTVYLG